MFAWNELSIFLLNPIVLVAGLWEVIINLSLIIFGGSTPAPVIFSEANAWAKISITWFASDADVYTIVLVPVLSITNWVFTNINCQLT